MLCAYALSNLKYLLKSSTARTFAVPNQNHSNHLNGLVIDGADWTIMIAPIRQKRCYLSWEVKAATRGADVTFPSTRKLNLLCGSLLSFQRPPSRQLSHYQTPSPSQ